MPRIHANPFTRSAGPLERGISVDELRVLNLRREVLAPADAQSLMERGGVAFQPSLTSGNTLRLQQLTRHTGAEMRAAIHRVLSTDASSPVGSSEVRAKEDRMRRVLGELRDTFAQIQSRGLVRT